MLRQKDLKRKRQLKELIEVARANDVLAAKIHELTLQLMAAGDLSTTVAVRRRGHAQRLRRRPGRTRRFR